ncbi:hypothetical protein AGOR_G00096200 [Albula goreensis]|uniref:C2H2-type domain-containing protein n=1 Tax=Albula goreensis TaxID=1534307 RepID=A0A8T3DMK4_9TELE|nr:hypothetical protein AGOR_G00096200 [Albula goreensis]
MLESSSANEMKDDTGERRFKCQICSKSYRHAGSLINHKHSHQTGIYHCSICRKHYPHLAALRSHLRIHKAKPSMLPLSSEGDWLSPEPLTLEGQQGDLHMQYLEDDDGSMPGLSQDFGEGSHVNIDNSHSNGLDEFEIREPVVSALPQDRLRHMTQGEPQVERHMCADCGKTYADIAGIKSHICPHRHQQQETISNGFLGDIPFQDPGKKALLEDEGNEMGSRGHCRGPDFQENAYETINSDGEANKDDEEDDGEKRFYNLLALKSHQRTHFDVKRHKCEVCGKAFKIQKQLVNHQRIHEGNRARVQELSQQLQTMPKNGTVSERNDMPMVIANMDEKSNSTQNNSRSRGQRSCNRCGETHSCKKACPIVRTQMEPQVEVKSEEEETNECRPYACDQCGRTYRHAGSLVNHKNSHKTGEYYCAVCNNTYSNQLAMKNHLRIHFAVKKHTCQVCGKAFRGQKQLSSHAHSHLRKKAPTTAGKGEGNRRVKAFQGKSGLKRHRCQKNQEGRKKSTVIREEGGERRFTCEQCGRSYRHAGSLLNHKKTHTTGIYHCTICLKTFSNLLALKNHRRIHSEVRRHCCPDCGKTFRVSSHLRSHRRVHSKERPISCTPAQRIYPSSSFRQQQELHHQTKQLPMQQADFEGGEIEEDWSSGLDLALMHAQGLDPNGLPDLAPALSCLDNSHLTELQEQQTTSYGANSKKEKVHVCEHCGRTYRHAGSLLNHKNSHKTGCFFCSACQKEFSNLMALKNHQRIHTEPKRYQCPDCGKAFRVSTQLICHRRIHTKEKPFSCPQCDKRFSSKSNLRHHQKVHQSQQNFESSLDMGANSLLGLSMNAFL